MNTLERFEQMLAQGKDNALLRYSLGNEYLKADNPCNAITHLREAVRQDPRHSASWKLLGRALAETGELGEALATYRQGIEIAEGKGDIQAAKEMKVFAKRIEKQLAGGSDQGAFGAGSSERSEG
jgi:predicted Zn-dependent protease